MTPEDWKKVERLEHSYTCDYVELTIDGFSITVVRDRLTNTRDGFVVYVDGHSRVKWMMEDCEERRRFLRPQKIYLYNGHRRTRLKKQAKSRNKFVREMAKEMLKKSTVLYNLHWNSIGALKKHLIENNNSIELASEVEK